MCVLEIFCSAVNLRTMNLKDAKLFARCIFVLVSVLVAMGQKRFQVLVKDNKLFDKKQFMYPVLPHPTL